MGVTAHNMNLTPLVIGPAIGLSERNAKIRRGGYLGTVSASLPWPAACWAQPSWPDRVLTGAREAGLLGY